MYWALNVVKVLDLFHRDWDKMGRRKKVGRGLEIVNDVGRQICWRRKQGKGCYELSSEPVTGYANERASEPTSTRADERDSWTFPT